MSDYLPLQIQEEIIERLPVKSLIQFRSVSKAWKAMIDSPRFIAAHSLRHTHPHHLLIYNNDKTFVSFVDDDTFPQQSSAPTLPSFFDPRDVVAIVGSSRGLFCIWDSSTSQAVLWNPSIRKSISIGVPNVKDDVQAGYVTFLAFGIKKSISIGVPNVKDDVQAGYVTFLAFGVCPVTNDPKIVKISQWSEQSNNIVTWELEVYSLSYGEWRTPSCNLTPHLIDSFEQVVIDKFIYWLASDDIDDFRTSQMIISFDMTTDELREVYLPHSLSLSYYDPEDGSMLEELVISKVWDSLTLLQYSTDAGKGICGIWMMERGVPTSFTKLFTIKSPYELIKTLVFRKNGEAIIYTCRLDDLEVSLFVFEPYSEHTYDVGILGAHEYFTSVNSYMETLLLLNQ